MPKIKDLSSKLKIPTAEVELLLAVGVQEIGQRSGGLSMFSNVFKRGHGNDVFGSDSNGIWLGAADYADAPFSVAMDGTIKSQSVLGSGGITIDGANVRITMTDGDGDVRGLWGDDGN